MRLLAAACIGFVLAACGADPISSLPASAPTALSPTSEPVRSAQPETSSAPSSPAEDASDFLDCDGPISEMGGRADDFGPEGTGDTPDEAFAAWVASNPFPLPKSGYRSLGPAGRDRWVYVYEVEGRPKVVVVISPLFAEDLGTAYTIEEMRTCEMAEYGAAVDLGPARRVWVHVETEAVLTDIEGPGHCEWQSARLLHVLHPDGTLDRQYVRDPEGVLPKEPLLETYAEGVDLPDDAVDSGYRSRDGHELWFTASDTAAYVITPDGIERWPRAEDPIGCA